MSDLVLTRAALVRAGDRVKFAGREHRVLDVVWVTTLSGERCVRIETTSGDVTLRPSDPITRARRRRV